MTGRKRSPDRIGTEAVEGVMRAVNRASKEPERKRAPEPHCEDDIYGPCGCPDDEENERG